MKRNLLSCAFNIDSACVELNYGGGTMITIDCTEVENALDANTIQCAALDYLIYNEPEEYADLVLSGGLEIFVKGASIRDYGLQD